MDGTKVVNQMTFKKEMILTYSGGSYVITREWGPERWHQETHLPLLILKMKEESQEPRNMEASRSWKMHGGRLSRRHYRREVTCPP